jgi:hypothetical protein
VTGYDAKLTDSFVHTTDSWVMTPRILIDMELTSAQNDSGRIVLRNTEVRLPDSGVKITFHIVVSAE